jgi:signal transduction histidine kinase/HAMP domain-containing protein
MSSLLPFQRLTLAGKFILLTAALILSTAVLLLLFIVRHEQRYAYGELLNHGLSVAAMMAQNCEYGVYTEDRATLNQIVASLRKDSDIAYVAVRNREGRLLVQNAMIPDLRIPSAEGPETSRPGALVTHREWTDAEDGNRYIHIVAPVLSGAPGGPALETPGDAVRAKPQVVGQVVLGLSEKQLLRGLRRFIVTMVAVTGVLILLGITLTVRLTRRIVSPIRKLSEATQAVAQGRMDVPIDILTTDEIGDLARSFEGMTHRLREFRSAVEERTAELLAANLQLQEEIGERRRAEESLRQRQQVLQSVYEMATTLGQSFQSLCEQAAVHLAGFLKIPIVLVQQIEDGQSNILAAVRDETLVDGEQIMADGAVWVRIKEINGLCLAQGTFCQVRAEVREEAPEEFKSLAGFPVKNSLGQPTGLIILMDRESRRLEADDLHLIEIYAKYMAYAMEQRDMERRLQSAQKTQVIAQLASGVAHEVRNPLNALLTLSEALFMDLGDNPEYKEFLIQIRVQVNRLSLLMQDLLELGKPIKPAQLKPEPLPPLCQQAIQMWRGAETARTHHVHLLLPRDPERMAVMAESLRMQQVLINLLDNAAQHSPENSQILMVLERSSSGYGRVQVIDQGSGIPEDVLPHVFEPFFTTRKKGTGLGMSLVRHIVENHGGTVAIWNNIPGPGCTVEIRIPLAAPPPGAGEV